MPDRSPEETAKRVIQYTSWVAVILAALFLWAASSFDSLGPAPDQSSRVLITISFVATSLSSVWWVLRQSTAPDSVRAAIFGVDVGAFAILVLATWTYPSAGARWLLLVGAAVLATAGIWLWRYRRLAGLRVATDEQGRVSVSDEVRRREQELRSQPW